VQYLHVCFECTDWSVFEVGATNMNVPTDAVKSCIMSKYEGVCIPIMTLTYRNVVYCKTQTVLSVQSRCLKELKQSLV